MEWLEQGFSQIFSVGYGKPDKNQRVIKKPFFALEVRSSIHLSYRRIKFLVYDLLKFLSMEILDLAHLSARPFDS